MSPNSLLQYCGFGVWNVHKKNGEQRPPADWVIVENAHKALISEEEARAIAAARQLQSRNKRFDTGYGRSRTSPYLLSGGLFRCDRCGANMVGFRTASGRYYVCGSQPIGGDWAAELESTFRSRKWRPRWFEDYGRS